MEDMYGQPQDYFPVDYLLDLSNDEIFSNSSSTSSADSHHHQHYQALPPPPPPPTTQPHIFPPPTADFTNSVCLPNEDVAELEWLSRIVDDSFIDFPAPPPELLSHLPNDKSFPNRPYNNNNKPSSSRRSSSSDHHQEPHVIRRCMHCASEKTPQWRTGPLGPKTLCNACGVRYKSGRLVPEYRPAASPTFVLTEHSNSHRKVMELRRQKEVVSQQLPEEQQQQQQQQFYLHPNGFRVC